MSRSAVSATISHSVEEFPRASATFASSVTAWGMFSMTVENVSSVRFVFSKTVVITVCTNVSG